MRETSAAKTALADYKAMGPGRSLEKLAAVYRTYTEHRPPTRHISVLRNWSVAHGWVAHAEAQDRAEDEKVLHEKAAQREKARERSLTIVQGAKGRYARQVVDGDIDYRTAKDLEVLVKLEMALLGEPLAEALDVKHGGEIGVTLRIVDGRLLNPPDPADGNGQDGGNGSETDD